jgi:hypothetical protein
MGGHLQHIDPIVGANSRRLRHSPQQAARILAYAGLPVVQHTRIKQNMEGLSHR